MRGFAPRKHLAQSLQPGLHHKTTFCFSASTCRQDSQARHFATAGKLLYGHSQPTPFRPDSLQSTMLSGRHYFPPGASRPTTFRRISFHTSPHSLYLALNLHSGLTGQYIPALILSLFFFHSTPLHTQKKGNRQNRFPSLFLAIPNLVQI